MGLKLRISTVLHLGLVCLCHNFLVIGAELHQGDLDNSYSTEEKQAVAKFRGIVKDVLYRDYMEEADYLIPWIRAGHMDLVRANATLRKAHQWRRENSIDTILTENWAQYQKNYPYYTKIRDRQGNPVVILPIGASWKVRKAVVAGQLKTLRRYFWRMMEQATSDSIYRRATNGSEDQIHGHHWLLIADLNGLNARDHLCLACFPLYMNFVMDYESYYPETANHCNLINTPRIFESVLRLIVPLMSERSRRLLKVFGPNRVEWAQEILSQIESAQLTKPFGGTRTAFDT